MSISVAEAGARRGRRGRPFVFWSTLLGGWLAMRLIVLAVPVLQVELARTVPRKPTLGTSAPARQVRAGPNVREGIFSGESGRGPVQGWLPPLPSPVSLRVRVAAVPVPLPLPTAPVPYPPVLPTTLFPPPERSLPLARLAPDFVAAAPPVPFGAPGAARDGRKSRPAATLDAWVLWRGGGADGLGQGQGYGGSQMGAIGQLALGRGFSAYLRGDRSLAGPSDQRVGAGLGLAPVAGVPIRLMAEGRLARDGGDTRAMPAVMAVGTIPPIALPRDTMLETYVAAGWVGGREATPFFDLQAVADHGIFGGERNRLRIGGGVWAGGQNHVVRLDVGPRLRLDLPRGPGNGYLALDYRIRVAGNARPDSGPAVVMARSF